MDAYDVNALWHLADQLQRDAKNRELWSDSLTYKNVLGVYNARTNAITCAEMIFEALHELEKARPDLAKIPK